MAVANPLGQGIQSDSSRPAALGFVGAYVFPISHRQQRGLEVGGDAEIWAPICRSRCSVRPGSQVDRWRRVRTDSTLSLTDAAFRLALEFFSYPAVACAWRDAVLRAPGA
ncbi:hypothetical protein THAOC_17927 [Thalassiosira oceanica]|uniref:Uncharacterized protein n=1 Tax=Thalassiosira oceanica TaxID=159749 RepID=K0S8D3_THAOC|nr:hypothetical protein THAOC_17927 [Thalassiosira oceanica]|eukprot:EJK61565.1 hypothetical protein THAOC_17927 [Thalassiosira oceanica]